MNNLTKEEYTDLYKTCKEMNKAHVWSLRKVGFFLLLVAFLTGFAAYSSYPHPAWRMPASILVVCLFLIFFLIFFFMPTAWFKRRVKSGATYQKLKEEIGDYL